MLKSLRACNRLYYGLSSCNLKKKKVQSFRIKVEFIFSINLPCACVCLWVGVTSSCIMHMLAKYEVQLNEMLILTFDFMFSNVGWWSR